MKKFIKDKAIWLLVIIIAIGAVLRFAYLNRVPGGISDDELDYVMSAQSVFYSGKTLDGVFAPFSLAPNPPNAQFPRTRAPYMLMAPFAGFIHGLGDAKLPYAAISILTTLVLVSIAWRLWGKKIAICTAFVWSFNPWGIYFGRTAFDTPLSVFFAYLFLWCLLYLRDWWLLLSIIPWIVGLYSYQGMIILYPLLLVIGILGIRNFRARVFTKQYVMLGVLGIVVFIFSMASSKNGQIGDRLNELAFPNNSSIMARVDTRRQKSVQTKINPLVLNKYSAAALHIAGQYIEAFSTKQLFVSGEERSTFSLWTHGWFYFFEFFLLIIGLYQVFRKDKKIWPWLFALILVSPIPSAISTIGASYALRSSLMYPLFCFCIAIGLATACSIRYHRLIIVGFVVLYAVSITNFLHIYFIQNPVNNSEGFGFSNRVLAAYMRLATDSGTNVLYVGNNVLNTYRQYVFFNNRLNSSSIKSIQKSVRERVFGIDNIQFIECPREAPAELLGSTIITPAGKVCASLTPFKETTDPMIIGQLSDSGRVFEIYNDTLCKKYNLSGYQPMISFGDLYVESMSVEKFCTTYISKPSVL